MTELKSSDIINFYKGSSRREERDWINILGFSLVQSEMTRLVGRLGLFTASALTGDARRSIFMGVGELLLLAIGLSMDAFAVSICKGLAMKKATLKGALTCGVWFGGFQALMPMVGFFLGALFANAIEAFDHWVAFGLLVIIGINMVRESLGREEGQQTAADFSVKGMFIMAVATSIDALAVGISLAMAGDVDIFMAVGLIGLTTFLLSAIGVKIGNVFGSRYEKKAEAVGGMILILLGVKILLEHLEVL